MTKHDLHLLDYLVSGDDVPGVTCSTAAQVILDLAEGRFDGGLDDDEQCPLFEYVDRYNFAGDDAEYMLLLAAIKTLGAAAACSLWEAGMRNAAADQAHIDECNALAEEAYRLPTSA